MINYLKDHWFSFRRKYWPTRGQLVSNAFAAGWNSAWGWNADKWPLDQTGAYYVKRYLEYLGRTEL